MALVDRYINTLEKFLDPVNNHGAKSLISVVGVEIAPGDDSGSVYRILKNINSANKLKRITLMTDAIAGATDVDLGFYEINLGPAIDVDALVDGQTLAVASRVLDGMSAVPIDNMGKRIWTLAGQTIDSFDAEVDIALTANVLGANGGTVIAIVEFMIN
jgi:hypothetical protein